MKNSSPIFIYSESRKTHIKTDRFELYIQGNPVFVNTPITDRDYWIREMTISISNNSLSLSTIIAETLKKTTGLFSLLLIKDNVVIIAADLIRSYPLFYGFRNQRLFVTDQLERFQKEHGSFDIDSVRTEEFITAGLVFGNGTTFKNVFGLQAGEILTINGDLVNSTRYFEFKPSAKPFSFTKLADLTKSFDENLIFVFNRMVELNPQVKNWVIPLSGGHDSRLIVNYLYRLGVKNVICFSYGTQGNEQSLISKLVAEAVGYKWYFVEYTEHKWKTLHDLGIFDKYIQYSFNGVSTPHLQDFLAVYELRSKNIIGKNDILLPGHTTVNVDVFCMETCKIKTKKDSLKYVYNRSIRLKRNGRFVTYMHRSLDSIYDESITTPENFMSYIDWQERRSKFISNSIRTYEYFGFQSSLPLWDREMVDYWLSLPSEKRIDRSMLFHTELDGGLVNELVTIPFVGFTEKANKFSIKRILKQLLPEFVIVKLLRITGHKVKIGRASCRVRV